MTLSMLYAIDLAALVLFAFSYYRNCYCKGYRIDIWHSQLFLVCVMPQMLMFPFAGSAPNAVVLGRDYVAVAAVVPHVFMLTMLGYVAVLFGGKLWYLRACLGIRKTTARILDLVPRCSMMLMSSRIVLVIQASVCLVLQASLLILNYIHQGFNFDLRSYAFANPALRPITQSVSFYSTIIAAHCLARYIDRKEKMLLVYNILLAIGMVLFGSRGGLIIIYMNVLVCCLMKRRENLSLVRLVFIGVFIVGIAFYLGNLRAGHYSLGEFFAGAVFLLLYGDNFSDLRDFAWVYARWDHSFWFGKTYLAALMAFVPRVASSFRDTWSSGAATAATVGLNPREHPGLRPGWFGEGYFNFGLCGIVVVGILVGIIFRRVDIDVRRVLQSSNPSVMQAFAFTMLLNIAATFALSVNSSTLYVIGGIYGITWLCLRGLRLLHVPLQPFEEVV